MRLLLDTHAFLWFVADDPSLSPTASASQAIVDALTLVSADRAFDAYAITRRW